MQKVISFTPNAPQYRSHSSTEGDKSRGQFIADHYVVIRVKRFIPMGMHLSEIYLCSIDVNLSPDEHRDTLMGANNSYHFFIFS